MYYKPKMVQQKSNTQKNETTLCGNSSSTDRGKIQPQSERKTGTKYFLSVKKKNQQLYCHKTGDITKTQTAHTSILNSAFFVRHLVCCKCTLQA